MMATLNLHPPAITSQKVVDQSIDRELPLLSTPALDGSTLMYAFNMEAQVLQMRGESIDSHQENNMLLGSLEVLESAGLTRLTRASFNFL